MASILGCGGCGFPIDNGSTARRVARMLCEEWSPDLPASKRQDFHRRTLFRLETELPHVALVELGRPHSGEG